MGISSSRGRTKPCLRDGRNALTAGRGHEGGPDLRTRDGHGHGSQRGPHELASVRPRGRGAVGDGRMTDGSCARSRTTVRESPIRWPATCLPQRHGGRPRPVAGPAARRPSPDCAELNGDDGQAPRRPVRTPSGVAATRRADRPSARVASHLNPLAAPCTGPQIGVVRGGREGPQPHPGVDVPVEEILFGEVISVDGHSCLLPACFGYSCTPLSPRLIKATILGGCRQVGPEFRS